MSAILEILPNGSWRFVLGKENPADFASRGLRPDQLLHHDLWWKGSKWLSESQTSWPFMEYKPAPSSNLEERPRYVMVAAACRPPCWELLRKYFSLTRLLRVTATCRILRT